MLLKWPADRLPRPAPALSARESARQARRIHHWHLQAHRGLGRLGANEQELLLLYQLAAQLRRRTMPR